MSGTRARRFRTDHAMVSVRSARIIHKLARLETSTSNFEIKHGRGGAAAMMPGLGGAAAGSRSKSDCSFDSFNKLVHRRGTGLF